jgi:hypothetical protein
MRKLGPEEVTELENQPKSRRTAVMEQYDAIIAELGEGWAEAELEPDESKATVRYRLKQAADRRGVGIEFLRVRRQNILMFRLTLNGTLPLFDDPNDEIFADVPGPQEVPF